MADNISIPMPGGPVTLSTEDVGGGVQMQRVKLAWGAAHSDGGDLSTSSPLPVQGVQPTTPTVTPVASSATNQQLLASNANRKAGFFFNDSTQTLYLKMGATASSTSFTAKLLAQGYYELPAPVYTGRIDGIWAAANGNCLVTELT